MNFVRDIICFGIIVLISFSSVDAADFIARENLKQFEGIIIKNKSAYEVYDKIKAKKSQKNMYVTQRKALEPYVNALVNKMTMLIKDMEDSNFYVNCGNGRSQPCRLAVSMDNYYAYGGDVVYVCSCGYPWAVHNFHFAEDKQAKASVGRDDLRFACDYAMSSFLKNLNKPKSMSKDEIKVILRRYGVEI